MAKYELTFLFHKKNKEIIETLENMLTLAKAKEVKREDWGVKPLAYPIKKLHEAYYVHFRALIDPAEINGLSNKIKLEDRVIRSLIVRVK